MIELGRRERTQPPPPHIVFAALAAPDERTGRAWLALLDDEVAPQVVQAEEPHLLVWSSLWPRRPDARVRFDIDSDSGAGTSLRWTLYVEEPPPDASLTGHLRKRLNQLINADLRYSFGQ